MAWETVPAPPYPTPNPYYLGNALSNLVGDYQQAQQGQQRTQANDIRNQQDQMILDQSKAFAGGVPMLPNGQPDLPKIMQTLVEKGDINALSALAPLIQQQQNLQGANAPDPLSGGFGGSSSTPAGGEGGTSKGTYSLSQMIQMAENAGFQGQDAAHIAAIAMAESGGDPGATGKAGEVGLTQINPNAWGFAASARDPQQAFNDAFQVYQKQGWGAWSTDPTSKNFTSGNSMARFLPQAETDLGGSGRTQTASLGDSDATAYATPETPAVPPVSAAAGSTIPRADGGGSTPKGAVGGAPAAAVPQQLAANNPAWADINAALPVGAGGTPASLAAPVQQSQVPAAPAQGSVASIASAAGIPPPVAANIAKAVGVAPGAPLTPAQAQRAKTIVQNYVQRTGQQPPQAGQGQSQGGGSLVPQIPLPNGIRDPMAAVQAINQDINRLARFTSGQGGDVAREKIRNLEWQRDQILKQSAPFDVRPGETLLDPRTRQPIFQAPSANANNIALQRFLAENPDASAEQIQQFMQAGRGGGRSAVGMYMQRFLQENPNASAEEVAAAAQNFQSRGSALTKFTSGPQGNAIRSFNVLVDHLGTLSDAATALKNGNMVLFNRVAQGFAQQTGSPVPTNFDATKAIVGDELVKAVVGGGGALGDREEIKAAVDKANSPQQLAGVIEQYKKLALGQLRDLRTQYSNATGRDDFDRFLAPGTQSFFNDKGTNKKSDQDSGGGHPPGNYNYDPATGNLEPVK